MWRGWLFAKVGASSLDQGLVGPGFDAAAGTGLVRLRMLVESVPWAAYCETDGRWRLHCMASTGTASQDWGLDGRAVVVSKKYEKDDDA